VVYCTKITDECQKKAAGWIDSKDIRQEPQLWLNKVHRKTG